MQLSVRRRARGVKKRPTGIDKVSTPPTGFSMATWGWKMYEDAKVTRP